ncbi:hypothetical protein QVD17_42212 [Tagetes erecta]|uniref:BAH domain-containing protein n=1 Tax=Tagetes erecta TaxID=13708 RepID=A0AAD8JN57_TARER|nr:hypothetical protein QVD17_42212 [Tagetes erecta]
MEDVNEDGNLAFKWLKKRGVGGKKKEIQFYESFMYDGVEYKLYDCVYMYKEGLQEPYIGKLTKIWERPENLKKVKVHWFFRPEEISKWLGETKTLENEIFFASGGGEGLANINPLEAIAGPCNVVCVSNDSRNPQPSDEELKAADFIFCRTFDVQSCTILDKMDDQVGGLEVKYIFNRKEGGNVILSSGTIISSETQRILTKTVAYMLKDDAKVDPLPNLVERNTESERHLKNNKYGVEKDKMKVNMLSAEKVENKDKKIKSDDEKSVQLKVAADSNSKQQDKMPSDDVITCEKQNNGKISGDDASFKVPDNSKTWITMNSKEKLKSLGNTNNLEGVLSNHKNRYREFIVTRKPKAESSTWFRPSPWEERLKNAYDEGSAILLHNLKPDYTSEDVEDIIWHAFNEKNCDAKILQRSAAVCSQHYSQALVLLKTKEAAQSILTKLDEECLMLSHERPLVATPCPPVLTKKNLTFFGHLAIDKTIFQNQPREDEAVSTSHFSQPNTIEYDMAMEWCLQQKRCDKWWANLDKQQGLELKKANKDLQLKRA